jgi:hypothetical protein
MNTIYKSQRWLGMVGYLEIAVGFCVCNFNLAVNLGSTKYLYKYCSFRFRYLITLHTTILSAQPPAF